MDGWGRPLLQVEAQQPVVQDDISRIKEALETLIILLYIYPCALALLLYLTGYTEDAAAICMLDFLGFLGLCLLGFLGLCLCCLGKTI